ncbi:hypothetical protein CLV98_101832 [Dyadobacter jejuensis]|uniref:Collagen triple helix repeat protein n=1 Tax=Dyadobacter jejuensis TaxID=1082580 RepID=A0A316BDR9_9BACT|nr:collagen-like protein [Dyadobacter jejuensis]PWJ60647.1 hypothetical protein CLV98_101832 [Dyadobacter jejuensis]
MLKKLSYFLVIGFLVTLFACEGPQGEVGPQGEKGDTGAQGPAGQDGEDGEDGDGTGSLPLLMSSGADSTATDGNYYTGLSGLSESGIAILEKSVVLVYIKSGGVYWPLPGIVTFGQTAASNFTFVHGIEDDLFFVDIYQTNWSEEVDNAPVRKFEDVRVVIMPTQDLARQDLEVDFNNYEEVVAKLGLSGESIGQLQRVSK